MLPTSVVDVRHDLRAFELRGAVKNAFAYEDEAWAPRQVFLRARNGIIQFECWSCRETKQ